MLVSSVCLRAKNGFNNINFFTGFVVRRSRNALAISAVSLCFVFIHYYAKSHWTEKLQDREAHYNEHSVKGKYAMVIGTLTNDEGEQLRSRLTELEGSSQPFRERSKPQLFLFGNKTHLEIPKEGAKRTVSNQDSNGLWLNEFTSGLSHNLAVILQDILTRDFEKTTGSPKRCRKGFFRLKGMRKCRKWLGCSDVNSLTRGIVFGNGAGKIVHVSEWKGMKVVIVTLRQDRSKNVRFVKRVQLGLEHMLLVQPSPYAAQVVGVCNEDNNNSLVLEYCKMGNFRTFFSSADFRRLSTMEKFKIAIQMVGSFDYLHRGLDLPRVHCDLHSVKQAFGQWVVSDDRRLFLSDLDELPIVDKRNERYATCIREPLDKMDRPNFVAPEDRYNQKSVPNQVDQYADVWKLPDLFANIMVKSSGKRNFSTVDSYIDFYFKNELKDIHDRCKNLEPWNRPSSKDLLIEYLKLYEKQLA